MALRVAIQMDALEAINPKSDSTLVLAREAQRRGHELLFYTPEKLTYRDGRITARLQPLALSEGEDFYALGEGVITDLAQMDVILLRQDPPYDMGYLTTTYLLEKVQFARGKRPLVANDPASVRDQPEKLFPILARRFMPPTLISADIREIEDFRREQGDIVLKPLYGHGGRAVFRLHADDGNFHAMMELFFSREKLPWIAQRFLPEVKEGDVRIVLMDGEFAGAVGRIPAQHEIRANFRVGGTGARAVLSAKQAEICEALKPELKSRGIYFAGVDVIGDWLTEINITSPTGLAIIDSLYEINTAAIFWDAVEAKL